MTTAHHAIQGTSFSVIGITDLRLKGRMNLAAFNLWNQGIGRARQKRETLSPGAGSIVPSPGVLN
jgi:hypothetical protein